MTYRSSVLALPGLVAFWPCDDANGSSTIADAGPNTVPLAVQTGRAGGAPTLGSGALLPEFTGALQIPGPAGSVATAAAGVGSPLRLTGGASLFGWARVTVASISSGTGLLGGRSNNWYTRVLPSGQIQGAVVTGGAGKSASSRTNFSLAQTCFWAVTYDPALGEVEVWCNAVRTGRAYATGTITATSDGFSLAENGGNAMVGAVQGVGLLSRRLDPGEMRQLIAAAGVTSAVRPEFAIVDLAADSSVPVVAQSASTESCAACGGTMRTSEPRVRRGGRAVHLGCYVVQLKPASRKIATSDTKAQMLTEVGKVMYDYTLSLALRGTNDKTSYFDGAKFVGPNTSNGWWRIQAGIGEGAALLARWKRAPASSWLVRLASQQVDRVLSAQRPSGALISLDDGVNQELHFSTLTAMMSVIALRPLVPAATFAGWRAKLVTTARFMQIASASNFNAPESGYYTNGNFEIMEALIYWLMFKLTGDAFWNAAFEQQWTFMISPPATTANAGFGLFTPVAPVANDWSDGKGYLAERGSSLTGLDWDYLGLQVAFAARGWLMSRDLRWLRMLNLFRNQMRDRLNTSTWIYDATGGTRRSLTDGYRSEADIVLYTAGRSDVALTGAGGILDQFTNRVEPDYRSFIANFNESTIAFGLRLGNWVMSADDFPALV